AITARIADGEYPAIVVAVVDGDRSHVYTFGKLGNGKAPDADTMFQIGSVTKTFTATLLAEAVDQDNLKLDTPVAKLLPTYKLWPRDGKQITLGELATQYSGLPRLPGNLDPAADPQDPYADYDAAKLKAFLAGYVLPRDPGSAYEYSNLGFGLLGDALAQQAGMSYAALLQKKILQPLGMSSTRATLSEPLTGHWAMGHDEFGKPAEPWHFGVLAGAGAINSTGADMLRYLEANMGDCTSTLQRAMQLAHQPRRVMNKNEGVGLAWVTGHGSESNVVWHNGMTGGYASFIGFTTDGRHGVVILTNIAQSVDDLGFAIMLPDTPLAPAEKTIAMSPQQLDAYPGQYQIASKFMLHIFREHDQLYAQATGQGAFPIFPTAKDAFFAKITDIRIDFHRGKDGKVESLMIHQSGHIMLAPKLDTTIIEKPAGHHAIHLDTATLQQYIGRYQLSPNVVLNVTFDKGQLMAQLTGQPSFPIYPSARDEFFLTVVDAQLSFKRDPQGKVSAVVLHQNGTNQLAKRIGW
ncbi:MAG: serine hydrolase, partial [Gammaproteobacteria bacterium]